MLPLLERASSRCAAVVGTVKNAGKTVTLNALVAEAGGSIDRRGFADAGLIKSIILATGMALGAVPEEVARKTAHLVEIFSLPLWRGKLPGFSSILLGGRWVSLGEGTLLGDEKRLAGSIPAGAGALFLRGALTGRLLLALKEEKKFLPIVLKSPSSFFAGQEACLSYRGGGGEIMVEARPDILVVTTNPWGHDGLRCPADLAMAVKKAVPGLPVVDVVKKMVL